MGPVDLGETSSMLGQYCPVGGPVQASSTRPQRSVAQWDETRRNGEVIRMALRRWVLVTTIAATCGACSSKTDDGRGGFNAGDLMGSGGQTMV